MTEDFEARAGGLYHPASAYKRSACTRVGKLHVGQPSGRERMEQGWSILEYGTIYNPSPILD